MSNCSAELQPLPTGSCRSKWTSTTVSIAVLIAITTTSIANAESPQSEVAKFATRYCVDCHSSSEAAGNFEIPPSLSKQAGMESLNAETANDWERVVRRLRSRQMPPPDAEKPNESEYSAVLETLESELAAHAKQHPQPGRTGTLRRLTRVEYGNAVRDLLALDVDVNELLPRDESSHGFDNITVEELSPLLLNRYLTAAEQISRLAVGHLDGGPAGTVVRVPQDRTQEAHVAGLPLGTRGGIALEHSFPQSGTYEIQVKLARDRDEKVEGLFAAHTLDILIDRKRTNRFEVLAPGKHDGWMVDHTNADAHLHGRFDVTAGPHNVGVTFVKKSASLNEIKRQPFDASFNRHRHPRQTPAVYEVSITGPFDSHGPGDTPSRRVIFGHLSSFDSENDKDQANKISGTSKDAEKILRRLLRLAYRRAISKEDLATPLRFFETGMQNGGFELGIRNALAAVLVNPNFLFRIETDPTAIESQQPYAVDPLALASRMSFFLWSSIPDDELLSLAEAGRLKDSVVRHAQVKRMLADSRSQALVTNFAAQWLYLRNLSSLTPDLRRFPDFDDNLRHAMRQETEFAFADIIENDRSVLELLVSDTTYLNDRLATHYGIPGVVGSHFRKVAVDAQTHRGGLLRHASILSVTSYATRTSPTIRGNWVLENVLGTPAPPPPPNVPNLEEKKAFEALSVRERLAVHRENPACASCHDLMDPIGFSLENFDAVGRWRQFDGELPLDLSGILPDGQAVNGIDDLESALLKYPELFVTAMTEKLLTFALGRGVELSDGPAIREIVRRAKSDDYRFSSLIQAIVTSPPFLLREPRFDMHEDTEKL